MSNAQNRGVVYGRLGTTIERNYAVTFSFRYEIQPGTDIGAMCVREVDTRNDDRFRRLAGRWARMRGLPVSFRVYRVYPSGVIANGSIYYDEVQS